MLLVTTSPLLFIHALVASVSAAANSTCYYPNGVANRGGACNPDADVSICCGPTFICLSNGLCQIGPDTRRTYAYRFYRSGCTDPTWNSTSCPQLCLEDGDNLDQGQGLQTCANNEYCCSKDYDCCANSTNILSLGVGNSFTTIPPLPAVNSAVSSTVVSSSSSTATPGQADIWPSNSSNSSAVNIGVGVGVGVGGFLLALLAVILLLRHRKKRVVTSIAPEIATEMEAHAKTEMEAWELSKQGIAQELDSGRKSYVLVGPHELEPQSLFELDGNESRAHK